MKRFTGIINEVEKARNICPKCEGQLKLYVAPEPYYNSDPYGFLPWRKLGYCQTCNACYTGWEDEDDGEQRST